MDSQSKENKLSWRDECLHELSGFANANRGKLVSGVEDIYKIILLNESVIPRRTLSGFGGYLGIISHECLKTKIRDGKEVK